MAVDSLINSFSGEDNSSNSMHWLCLSAWAWGHIPACSSLLPTLCCTCSKSSSQPFARNSTANSIAGGQTRRGKSHLHRFHINHLNIIIFRNTDQLMDEYLRKRLNMLYMVCLALISTSMATMKVMKNSTPHTSVINSGTVKYGLLSFGIWKVLKVYTFQIQPTKR